MRCYLLIALLSGTALAADKYECSKRVCKQMTSCEEAKYHLTQCGVKSLDRDGDGIPCESICGGARKRR